jgi:glycosyltransferase involved in cell wall biosynthesis
MRKVALIIPVYNEERNIEAVLQDVQNWRGMSPDICTQVWVIDDGSTDLTARLLVRLKEEFTFGLISLSRNYGIGAAVRTGFEHAARWGADVILQIDGDGQHPAGEISKLIGPILAGEGDVVVGSRYLSDGGGRVSSPFRRVGTWVFSVLLRLLVGIKIRDTTSGFRAFSREAARFISPFYAAPYPEVKTYVPLVLGHFRIIEVPVLMRRRRGGTSSITSWAAVNYMFRVGFGTVVDRMAPGWAQVRATREYPSNPLNRQCFQNPPADPLAVTASTGS